MASNSDAAARNSVLSNEITRNRQLNQNAAAVNAHSEAQFENFVPQQTDRAKQLGDYFGGDSASKPDAATSGVMPTSSSDIVNQDETKQLAKVDNYATQQAGALGELRSFGDLLGDKTRTQARDASQVGQIGNDMKGYATNVVPYQLDAAKHSGDTARTLGDVLALGGSLASGVSVMRNPTSLSFLYGGGNPGIRAGANVVGGALSYPSAYGG